MVMWNIEDEKQQNMAMCLEKIHGLFLHAILTNLVLYNVSSRDCESDV